MGKAIELYEKAIALDPTYPLAYNNLGAALLLQEDPYTAIGKLQRALTYTPHFAEALNNLGVAFWATQNSGKAHTSFTEAHQLAPMYDAALFNLGKLAYEERQRDTAQQHWTAYLQLDPSSRWAKAIRQTLELPAAVGTTPPPTAAQENLLGASIGMFRDQLPSDWGEPKSRELRVGNERLSMAIYKNRLAVMAEGDEVHLIATLDGFQGRSGRAVVLGSPEAEVRTQYGPPARIVSMSQGTSWVYDVPGIAFQLYDGRVVSWLVF